MADVSVYGFAKASKRNDLGGVQLASTLGSRVRKQPGVEASARQAAIGKYASVG